MTDNTENRIRLAEWQGWTHIRMKYVAMDKRSYPFGCVPGNVNDTHLKEQIPDPYTDANDCEALIRHLRKRGWLIRIEDQGTPASPLMPVVAWLTIHAHRPFRVHRWRGPCDDYKQGVCELALKVLDND